MLREPSSHRRGGPPAPGFCPRDNSSATRSKEAWNSFAPHPRNAVSIKLAVVELIVEVLGSKEAVRQGGSHDKSRRLSWRQPRFVRFR
jgi:hypothetical protein